jgi:hypothetical protein
VRGGGAGGKARTWRAGWSASGHTPTESICDLALASFAPPHAGNGGVRFLFFCVFRTYVTACSCRDAHLPHGGWRDCSDGHALSICWNRACFHSFHRPSCPCPSWFVVDVVNSLGRHSLKLISIFSALHPTCHHGKDTVSTRRSTSSQQPRSGRLLCFAPFMPVLLLVRRARLPTSDDNLCRHHPYAHTHCGER